MKRSALTLFVFGLACIATSAFAYVSPGRPTGYVNDYTGTLSTETKTSLEDLLKMFQASGKGEVSVVVISTLGGDAIENYSIALAREWQIGVKGKDNGALLLIAKDDHQLRIEVGYGFEGMLTDAKSSRIIHDVITPRFKEGNYDAGVTDGVKEIVGLLDPTFAGGTQTVDYTAPQIANNTTSPSSIFPLIIFGFIFLRWIALILGSSKSWWFGGVLGAGVGGFVAWTHLFGLAFPFGWVVISVLTLAGLLFDFVVSRAYGSSVAGGNTPPWWLGGGSSGGSSGGGFGGFGGGSFGGGGSSGRW